MIYRITYKDKHKYATPVKNRAQFLALRNSKTNLSNLEKARRGDNVAKGKLVQFAYNLGHVDGALAGCKSIGSYFFHDIDCYDKEQSEAICKQILDKKDEIGLKMLEKSASGGWHLVCKREPGLTILEAQVKISTILRIEMDTNTHDLQRVAYGSSGSAEDLVFLDDELFSEPMTAEKCEAEYARLKERERSGGEQIPATAKKARKHYKPWEEVADELAGGLADELADVRRRGRGQGPATTTDGDLLCGRYQSPSTASDSSTALGMTKVGALGMTEEGLQKINERTRFIMEAVLKAKGLEPCDFVNDGGRHNAVKIFLSGANQLLSKEEANGVLAELMPEHWNDQNIQDCIRDFYDRYYDRNRKLNRDEEAIFTKSRRLQEAESPQPAEELDPNTPMSELSKLFASRRPPELPQNLPKLVKEVTRNTPQKYKATVSQAMFPPLATYPRKLSFVYIDNQVRDLRVNCLIVAITGSGKDSSTGKPLERLIAPMKQRDDENRARLKKFNDECNSKAANKQSPKRPDDLIIQTIMSDITKAGLVQRMDEAQGAPLYVKLNELEQWDKIEAASGRGNQFTVMKLCDDEHNIFGTDRAGTQSVTATGCLHLNWNASTTISKAIRYFRYVLTDGPVSRLCLATIPEDEIGADISVFGNYDEAYDEALKPYIDNLSRATGVVDCQQAKSLARKLKDECADFARLSQDRVFDNLSHRALVIAFRKACLLYVANGMRWEKSIEAFCRWSLFYDLYMKMTLFGELIRHADDELPTSKHGPQSLLDLLPSTFTIEDAQRIRIRRGMAVEKTGNMISTWKKRHYVVQMADGSYKKASVVTPNRK